MAGILNNTVAPTGQKGLVSTNPFASFGSQPTNTNPNNNPTPTFGGLASGISGAFGNMGPASTQPFANGALATGANAATINPTPVKTQGGLVSPSISALPSNANLNGTNGNIANNNLKGLVSLPNANNGQTQNTGTGTPGLVSLPQPQNGYAGVGNSYNGAGQIVPTSSIPTGQTSNQAPSTYPGLVTSLATTASQPSAAFTADQQQALVANQALAQSKLNESQALSDNSTNEIPLEAMEGRGAVIQNQYLSQQNALADELQGAGTLEQAATGQQGTQQSGLAAASGLAQPQPANALGTYNPVTGQYEQYGGAAGGGAATAGGVNTQISQGAAVQNMTGIFSQAQGLASTLSGVIKSSGYNPNDLGAATTYANGINQWLQGKSGNPQYQNAANLISEVANKYAAILNQSGGTPTSVSQVQSQIINGLASGQQIETVLGNLAMNAQTSIDALKGASQNNANATGNTNNSTPSGYTGWGATQ
jgi:hypothetical protein